MNIGPKLKEARMKSDLTQEQVAEEVMVSRQTISNWENEKSYPDIMSIVKLSDLYSVSLDELLKGDQKIMKHLEESTDIVKSNKKLIGAIAVNIVLFLALFIVVAMMPQTFYMMAGVFSLAVIGIAFLLYEIVQKI
ncbi:helix-turn-helix domain-containing protein [Hespellia stercorisuis]|uniref:DNA-binding transcriptional regulator, XRE-family HTH domain n=1 Tax=Hespellia stercorisuis DSM 15480 TaxID=1121950 RepID=A0A1M6U5C8_9FIRM|nr:helix-turn-helix transcriptional regulator [Hespellia stercorisuis]SHK64369.1 DNA-binding transcriptional regulator, XRE-family HTH domain [Hespellia stercorisuis DSM 15480]